MALPWTSPAGGQADRGISWSPELHLKSTEDIPTRLRQPELPASKRLILRNGKASREVGNCLDYLGAVSTGFHPGSVYETKMAADFVYDCFVLRDLQHARPAATRTPYQWTVDSLNHLPPVLVPGAQEIIDTAEDAEQAHKTWKQFDPTLKINKISGDLMLAEDHEHVYSLEILARGDFNGDSVEDIAVYATAQGKRSTWSHAEYLILSPTNNGTLVRLTDSRAPYGIKPHSPD